MTDDWTPRPCPQCFQKPTDLFAKIEALRGHKMTWQEMLAQKRSFIRGEAGATDEQLRETMPELFADVELAARDAEVATLRSEVQRLTGECDEQARLNGMGSERELALMAERDRLALQVQRAAEALKGQDEAVRQFLGLYGQPETVRAWVKARAFDAHGRELLAADMHRRRAHSLAVAIIGGEDAPGYAESIGTETLVEMMRQSRICQNRADDRCDEFERARDRARRHSERLTAGIRAALEGEIARPLGERWRADGEPSSHDRCIHGAMMNEDCPDCLETHLSALIASPEAPEDQT